MRRRLCILIAILFLSFPCLAYGEISVPSPMYGDSISTHGDMQIEFAVHDPVTKGWQKKKDITGQSALSILMDIHHFPYKHSIRQDIMAKPHLFLTPYFYQGGYLSFTVI